MHQINRKIDGIECHTLIPTETRSHGKQRRFDRVVGEGEWIPIKDYRSKKRNSMKRQNKKILIW